MNLSATGSPAKRSGALVSKGPRLACVVILLLSASCSERDATGAASEEKATQKEPPKATQREPQSEARVRRAEVAREAGATVVPAPQRGYGSACLVGIVAVMGVLRPRLRYFPSW